MFPQKNGRETVAPGQYNFNPSLGGTVDTYTVGPIDVSGDFYVIIHGVSCEITCECSSGYTYTGDNGGDAFGGDSADECPENTPSKTADFTAYPVPFNNEVFIKYNYNFDTDVKIEVFDIRGVRILTTTDKTYSSGTNGRTRLDLSNLDNQMFLVKVSTANGSVVKKIVSSK